MSQRFELLLTIGVGGSATVYLARDRHQRGDAAASASQRESFVAIKRAHPQLRGDPAVRKQMVREASLASRLMHPHVAAIRQVEDRGDELLLVMDYIPGASLAELLSPPPEERRDALLPVSIGLRILRDAADGLNAVHGLEDDAGKHLGFVHRDISPQNILTGIDGVARLADFGLAKLTEVSMTRTEVMRGKMAYMAPEYLVGDAYTQSCDAFAFGVVMWEALAGKRLFLGKHEVETMDRVRNAPAPPLCSVRSAVPPQVEEVVAQLLAKDAANRPSSMAVVVNTLTTSAMAAPHELAAFVEDRAGERLAARHRTVDTIDDAEPTAPGVLALNAEDFQLPDDW
jgi:serine/threonine protein kinase